VIPRWAPNALSALRIASVPAWLALALVERGRALDGAEVRRALVIAVLLAIGATDVLDGQLARRFGLASNLGATLDAVADKLATVVAVTFLAFLAAPAFTPLPLWLWAALVLRDLLLAAGFVAVWRRHGHVQVEHRWHGRLATLVLFATVVAACAGAPALAVGAGSLAVVLLIVPGTADYLRNGWRQLHAPAQTLR